MYPTDAEAVLDGLTAGTSYKVKVRARYQDDSGPWTDEVTKEVQAAAVSIGTRDDTLDDTLGTISDLSADPSAFLVILTWTAIKNNAITEYELLRGSSADDLAVIGTATTAVYADGPVEAETTYYYAVRARSATGFGPTSDALEVTTTTATVVLEQEEEPLVSQGQQSASTLVSNLATAEDFFQGVVGNQAGTTPVEAGVSITTGRHSGGYSVSAVQAKVSDARGVVADLSPKLYIHADSSGAPGAVLHTLTTSSTSMAAGSTLTFSVSGVTLDPTTKYWMMFGDGTTTASTYYTLKRSSSLNEEPCGGLDFSVGNDRYRRYNGDLRTSSFGPLAVAVLGQQVDNGSVSERECEDASSATTTDSFTLVSNLDTAITTVAGTASIVGRKPDSVQTEAGTSITTGGHPTGYTVNTVQLPVRVVAGRTNLVPKLKIHADSSGAPGALLHTLTSSTTSLAAGPHTLEYTASPAITLQPNTKFWLMFADETTVDGNNYWSLGNNNLYYQGTSCGEPGFAINSGRYDKEGTTLTSRPSKEPISIAVIGSPVGGITVSCQTPSQVTVTTNAKVGMGKTAIGAFQSDNDADWYAVELVADEDYQFDMFTGINGGGDTAGSVMDIAVYSGGGELQTINLMEVDPEIYHVASETSYWEKRRAYFMPATAGTYYLKATLKGSAHRRSNPSQFPTYTVRVREADDYDADVIQGSEVAFETPGRGHFFTEHGSSGHDVDWFATPTLVGGETYTFTLTGHATANTQMRILGIYNQSSERVGGGADPAEYSSSVSVQYTPTESSGLYHVAVSSEQRVRMCQNITVVDGVETAFDGDPFPCEVQAKHPAPDYTLTIAKN